MAELLTRRDRMITSVLDNRQYSLEMQAEKAEAVSALRRSEEEYRTVVESLHEVIFRISESGQLLFLNSAWSAITGYTSEQSLGRALTDFVHPDDGAPLQALLGKLQRGDVEESRSELRLLAQDGSLRWAELRARHSFEDDQSAGAVTGTIHDLTRSKQAEEQLRRREATSKALLAALPDQVFGLSRSGVFISHSGVNNNGDSPVGKNLEAVFPREIAREYRRAVAQLFASKTVQVFEYRLDNGRGQRQYEARFAMAGEDEAVAIVRNVSDRKRLEDQLREGQKLEAIGRLAGGLAHDFNNLLTVVQGNAHLLMEEFSEKDVARGLAQEIDSAADRGADLIRQLLAFGRRQVMQPRVLNLNTVIASVHPLLPRLIGEDVLIDLKLDPELGLVRADPGQFEQVIVNLVAYARTRMPGGGTLHIGTANLPVAPERSAQNAALPADPLVRFTLSDTGPPLDEQARAHAFEPFYGAIGSAPGGLGLATVYGIVSQSDGMILLEDAPHGGARFQVYLPRVDLS
jgi:PAS domain S-box-containing protein